MVPRHSTAHGVVITLAVFDFDACIAWVVNGPVLIRCLYCCNKSQVRVLVQNSHQFVLWIRYETYADYATCRRNLCST